MVVPQAGRDVDVAGHKGIQPQSIGPAGYGLGHLHRVDTAREFVGDKDDRLGGVVEHDLHLVAVGYSLWHVYRQDHGHHKADVGQSVSHDHAFDDVLKHRTTPFTGAVIDDVQAIRAGPIEAPGSPRPARALDRHNPVAVAVAEHHPPGHRDRSLLHQPRWDAHQVAIRDMGTGFSHQIDGLLLVEADTGALQYLQAGPVDLLALLLRHALEPGRLKRWVVDADLCHGSPLGQWSWFHSAVSSASPLRLSLSRVARVSPGRGRGRWPSASSKTRSLVR